MKVAIKIGGSVSIDEFGPKVKYFKKLIPVLDILKKKVDKLIVGIGGGKFVRNYYSAIGSLLCDYRKELLAIDLLKANVRFLSYLIGGKPVFSFDKIPRSKILCIGGIKPGRSTDANTSYLAAKFGVDYLIFLTDVNGIYNRNPKKFRNAKLIKYLHFKDLDEIIQKKTSPGNYGVIDPVAIKIIKQNKIHTFVVNGNDPKSILRVLDGEKIGTEIYG